MMKPADAGDEALVERLLAQRGRDLRGRDELELDRQGARLEQVGQPLGRVDREAARDPRPAAAAQAVGVLVPVDLRDRDQLVVQRDGEVLVGRRRPARRARTPGRAAASLRVNFDHTPAPWPVKSKVTFGWPLSPGPLSKPCSGFLMSVPPRIGWSLSTYQAGGGLPLGSGCSARTMTTPCGTLTTCLASKGIFLFSASFCRSRAALVGAGEDLLALLVDQVELVARGLLAGVGARALRAARDGVEERQRGRDAGVAGRLPAGHVRVLRIGLAVGPEDAALPVVEPHLGGGADLRGRLVGVLDVGQRDVDLVGARALEARARRRRSGRRACA